MAVPITELRHPNYTANIQNWHRWRLAYEGGDRFIRQYLKKYGKRETNEEFNERKEISYCPAFAKAAINEVKNGIFQRMSDVTRLGGTDSYQLAAGGSNFGVDLLGNSMNSFMGRRIIPELLTMGRVGVYVDMPELSENPTKRDAKGKRPYLCWYRAEDIYSWEMDCGDQPNEFTSILLGDTAIENDPEAFLPSGDITRYRHLWIGEDGYVWCQMHGLDGTSQSWTPVEPFRLNIKRIPFVMLEITESLMMDVANYQIGLLNLASSDISYAIRSNFPMYVEQFDNRTETPNIKTEGPNAYFGQSTTTVNGQTVITNQENNNTIKVGAGSGRKYPLGTNQPAFINPSSEPLDASMKKQAQMKAEIRELINLAVSNLSTADGPSEQGLDDKSFESGLSYIGLELEVAERKIAEFWSMYEGSKEIATVSYPESYSIVSEEERLASAGEYIGILPKIPSKTFQKEMAKKAIRILLGNKVPAITIKKMMSEVDAAEIISIDPDVIMKDFTNGFVGLDTASKARGYPAGEVAKASKDHEDRVARIAIAQSEGGGMGATGSGQARGTPELGANNSQGKQEKVASKDTSSDHTVTSKVRGEGK